MPDPAYMRLVYKDKPLESNLSVCGEDNLFEILEARHSISIHDFNQPWHDDWNPEHKPFSVVMEVNSLLPLLYMLKKECDQEYLTFIEIFWMKKSETSSKNEFYFKHLLEPAKVFDVRMFYPNIKDPATEKFNHLVEVSFRYHFITLLHIKGFLLVGKFEARWWYSEFSNDDGLSREKVEELLSGPAATDKAAVWEENYKKELAAKQQDTTKAVISEETSATVLDFAIANYSKNQDFRYCDIFVQTMLEKKGYKGPNLRCKSWPTADLPEAGLYRRTGSPKYGDIQLWRNHHVNFYTAKKAIAGYQGPFENFGFTGGGNTNRHEIKYGYNEWWVIDAKLGQPEYWYWRKP